MEDISGMQKQAAGTLKSCIESLGVNYKQFGDDENAVSFVFGYSYKSRKVDTKKVSFLIMVNYPMAVIYSASAEDDVVFEDKRDWEDTPGRLSEYLTRVNYQMRMGRLEMSSTLEEDAYTVRMGYQHYMDLRYGLPSVKLLEYYINTAAERIARWMPGWKATRKDMDPRTAYEYCRDGRLAPDGGIVRTTGTGSTPGPGKGNTTGRGRGAGTAGRGHTGEGSATRTAQGSDNPIDLGVVIRDYPQCLVNRLRLRGLLLDLYIKNTRQINLAMYVYESGILEEIRKNPGADQRQQNRWINILMEDYGISEENAYEAINMWIKALEQG